jgi:hypothetical protein
MSYVCPEWSHGMTYDDNGHSDATNGEVLGLGLTDEDVDLLRGVDCDILTPVDGDILVQSLI